MNIPYNKSSTQSTADSIAVGAVQVVPVEPAVLVAQAVVEAVPEAQEEEVVEEEVVVVVVVVVVAVPMAQVEVQKRWRWP
jgi:hypothetical protein